MNISIGLKRIVMVTLPLCLTVVVGAGSAQARTQVPLIAHFGGSVNQTDGGLVCAANEKCQTATEGSQAGWFASATGVAVDQQTGAVYVADAKNDRVEKLGPNGEFLAVWGWNVNKHGGNVCVAGETSECQQGQAGTGLAEQLSDPQAVAVDQQTHDVFVLDREYHRVDVYGPDGKFVMMLGGEVNKTGPNSNVCTAAEVVDCQAGKEGTTSGSFKAWPEGYGSLLAIGGPEDLLYVADEGRVQEFKTGTGAYSGQLSLTATTPSFPAGGVVSAITVDDAGDVYVSESHALAVNAGSPNGVHEFGPAGGSQLAEFDGASGKVEALALDPYGRLTVTDEKTVPLRGALFSLTGSQLVVFGEIGRSGSYVGRSLAFDRETERLYATRAVPAGEVNELTETNLPSVTTGSASETTSTTTKVVGQANAEEEPESTPARLAATPLVEYGACGSAPAPTSCTGAGYEANVTATPEKLSGMTATPVQAELAGLTPNQTYQYRLVATNKDGSVQGSVKQFTTQPAVPQAEQLQAEFPSSSSIILFGQVNPEHANTTYKLEYVGEQEYETSGWTNAKSVYSAESSAYATLGLTQELTGLQSDTAYRARLTVQSQFGQAVREASFTTSPVPVIEAVTGSYSSVTTTTAVISGTVNPDGKPAAYTLELGRYDPAGETQYGIVISGSTGTSNTPVSEQTEVSGLLPGTTYAYRIKASSAYGTVVGAPVVFQTAGLPTMLVVPATLGLLSSPAGVSFPQNTQAATTTRAKKCGKGMRRDKHGKCVKTAKHKNKKAGKAHKKHRGRRTHKKKS